MTPEQFLELARVLPEPMLLITSDGRMLAVNPALSALLLMPAGDLLDRPLTAIVVTPPSQVAAYLKTCARSRSLVFGALTFSTADGRLLRTRSEGGVLRPWSADAPALILLRLQRHESASSQFLLLNTKIDELSREIRERRRAQEEAYHERERLRVTLASIGDAVIVTDAQGRITFMNSVAETLTGWNQQEAAGLSLSKVFPIINEETRQPIENPADMVLRVGHIVGLANHTVLCAKGGVERLIDDSGAPIRDENGTIIGVVLVFRDVTELRRRQERQHFVDAVSALLAGSLEVEITLNRIARVAIPSFAAICLVDLQQPDGSIQRVATAHIDPDQEALLAQVTQPHASGLYRPSGYWRVFETGVSELIADLPAALAATAAPHKAFLTLLARVGVQSVLCVPMVRRERPIGALTFATLNPNQRYTHEDMAFAEELANRCAIALDNAQLYRAAQEATRLRDIFLSIASHELKTPLTSLSGHAELLLRRITRDPAATEVSLRSAQVIVEQATKLNNMIAALLDVSRIETGQLAIRHQMIDLSRLVERVVAEVEPTLERHRVVCELPPDPVLLDGDELRLEQVLQNLVANAVKYSPAGGSVTVRVERQGDRACIEVRDQGIGIPHQEMSNLFERFYRASNADGRYISGLGIGLFVVKEIVVLHGGEITAASTEGEGSTFTVYLPLAA